MEMKTATTPTIEPLPVEDLIPYARNSRTHSEEQVAQIAASIREFGFTNPVLIDAEGTIIAGHGRVMAARKLGLESVPCIRLGHLTPAQVRAYVIADNKLALNAGWDEELLKSELQAIQEDGFDIGLTGFSDDEIKEILGVDESDPALSDDYTHKIDAPIYSPKGEKPPVQELFDTSKAEEFIRKIDDAKLPTEISQFLKSAAARHFVFNYEKIAEFYCHADKPTQELMEDLALVIIDFKKALQLGYVQVKDEVASAIEGSQNTDDSDE